MRHFCVSLLSLLWYSQLLSQPLMSPKAKNENTRPLVVKENFNATLTVKVVMLEKNFAGDGSVDSKTETEYQYSTKQLLSLNTVLLDRLKTSKQNIDLCTSRGMCVLMQGNSELPAPANGNRPVDYSFASKTFSKCEDKLVLTRTSEGGGKISEYMLTSLISVYKYNKPVEDFVPVPLVKLKNSLDDINPLPLTNAKYYTQLSVQLGGITPNLNAAAGAIASKNYDCGIKTWQDEERDKRYGVSVRSPAFLTEGGRSKKDGDFISYYINPIVPAIELMNYLNNPVGSKTFTINSRGYEKSPSGDIQTDVYITLVIE